VVAKNVGGGSASAGAGMEGEHSTTSTDLSGDTFVEAALQGMGGGPTAKASTVAPMPGILGDDSSCSKSEDGDGGDASPSKDADVGGTDCRPMKAPLIEESGDELEQESPPAQPSNPTLLVGTHREEDREMDAVQCTLFSSKCSMTFTPFSLCFSLMPIFKLLLLWLCQVT